MRHPNGEKVARSFADRPSCQCSYCAYHTRRRSASCPNASSSMKQASGVLPTRKEEPTATDASYTRWLDVKLLVATPPRSEESTATDASYNR